MYPTDWTEEGSGLERAYSSKYSRTQLRKRLATFLARIMYSLQQLLIRPHPRIVGDDDPVWQFPNQRSRNVDTCQAMKFPVIRVSFTHDSAASV